MADRKHTPTHGNRWRAVPGPYVGTVAVQVRDPWGVKGGWSTFRAELSGDRQALASAIREARTAMRLMKRAAH